MYDHGPHREFLFGQVPQGTVKLSADISSKGKAEGGFNKEGWNPRILTNDDAIFLGLLCVLNQDVEILLSTGIGFFCSCFDQRIQNIRLHFGQCSDPNFFDCRAKNFRLDGLHVCDNLQNVNFHLKAKIDLPKI